MTTNICFKRLSILGSLILLTACGDTKPPAALDLIVPEEDETGFMQELHKQNGSQPMNLLEAVLKQGVPSTVAKQALLKYDQFSSKVRNSGYITMVDFTQHSGRKRMYVVNRKSGKVDTMAVAHGEGSDPDNDGYAQFFSNVPNSKMSSLGSYIIAEKYQGKYGASMRMDGLERTNSNARPRAVVLHPANYVKDSNKKQGRSWGCPAVPFAWISTMLKRVQGGGFMYAYGINKKKSFAETYELSQWELIPKHLWVNESEEAPIDGI